MKRILIGLWMLAMLAMPLMAQDEDAPAPQTPEALCAAATPSAEGSGSYEAPEQVMQPGVDYRAIFCTGAGPVYIDLFETVAPFTVNSFIFLAQQGFYDGTTFHRVLENFMAQGGDPTGTGTGGPGYSVIDEYAAFMMFDRPGLLATANSNNRDAGRVNTNGSQFFITTVVTDWLNFNHSIFGEVLTGQEIVESIELRDPATAATPGMALNTVIIIDDPAVVEADYAAPERATQETLEALAARLPETVGLEGFNLIAPVTLDTAAVVAAEGDLAGDAESFYATYGHQYTIATGYTNTDCDFTATPVQSIGYALHVFESAEQARAALQDPLFLQLLTDGAEYEEGRGVFSSMPAYIWPVTACDGNAGFAGKMVRQVGRMIGVIDTILPADSPLDTAAWLDQVAARVYEVSFGQALRDEIVQ